MLTVVRLLFQQSAEVNDPMWKDMWYLNRRDDLNMNVQGAWRLGFTGTGVAVTILEWPWCEDLASRASREPDRSNILT